MLVLVYNTYQTWLTYDAARQEKGPMRDRVSIETARLAFGIQAALGAFSTGMLLAGIITLTTQGNGWLIILILTAGAPFMAGLSVWVAVTYARILRLLGGGGEPPATIKEGE
jgi:hypothetical protein